MCLLGDTRTRVATGSERGEYPKTTVGVPQGDALSPVVLVTYLEFVLRDADRQGGSPCRTSKRDYVVQYADDTTLAFNRPRVTDDHELGGATAYCRRAKCATARLQATLPVVVEDYGVKVSQGETEYVTLAGARQ